MIKHRDALILCLVLATLLSSCQIVGGIFKAGVWTGVFIVVAIIVLIIVLITRSSAK